MADRRGRGGKHGGGDWERVGGPCGGGGEAVAGKAEWSRGSVKGCGGSGERRWQSNLLGVVEAPEGRGESCGGWKKGREETRLGRRGKGVYGKVMEKARERIGRLMVRNEESDLGKYDGKVLARSSCFNGKSSRVVPFPNSCTSRPII